LGSGRLGPAIECYERALELRPEDSLALFGATRAYARTGDQTRAWAMLQRLQGVDPKLADQLTGRTTP
jgi:tetratricopeptide (TPR) repeat protein